MSLTIVVDLESWVLTQQFHALGLSGIEPQTSWSRNQALTSRPNRLVLYDFILALLFFLNL